MFFLPEFPVVGDASSCLQHFHIAFARALHRMRGDGGNVHLPREFRRLRAQMIVGVNRAPQLQIKPARKNGGEFACLFGGALAVAARKEVADTAAPRAGKGDDALG